MLSLATAAGLFAASAGTPAFAALSWYDGFAIDDADPGDPTTYVSGALGGQDGGTGTFFTGTWQATGDDNVLAAGSLTRSAQSPASTGDKASDQPATGCCNTARTGHQFATPLQNVNGTVYMGFLVNFGLGNPSDPHYRAVEFWNGAPGDGNLNMSLGISSFGNYNNPVNDADGPAPDPNPPGPGQNVTANRQISARVDGVREEFGLSVQTNHQLEEHIEWADQLGETHSVVIKFELSTNDVEVAQE